jgi:hypothetical protein
VSDINAELIAKRELADIERVLKLVKAMPTQAVKELIRGRSEPVNATVAFCLAFLGITRDDFSEEGWESLHDLVWEQLIPLIEEGL